MRVLVACEESQEVCKAFRVRGHEAYSCDIQECSGGRPEWHIVNGVLPILNGGCTFETQDGKAHSIDTVWDLVVAHPPCTYLCVSGNRWFDEEKYKVSALNRYIDRIDAICFFMKFVLCSARSVAIENPIWIMSSVYRKPDQVIQPYEFGHRARKATCLWLKNLPKLVPTCIVEPEVVTYTYANGKKKSYGANMLRKDDGTNISYDEEIRQSERSKTFPGIAMAMAEQWGR